MPTPSDDTPDDVVLVDEHDRPLRVADKTASHSGRGTLHRAFTLLVFDHDARLLLARRADDKPLWAGRWDGTVASHPRADEDYGDAALRRLPDELELADGASPSVAVLNRFLYRADDDDGAENELCATVVAVVEADDVVRARPDEISSLRWVGVDAFADELAAAPTTLCPWLLIALEFITRGDSVPPPEESAAAVSTWARGLDPERLAHALTFHRVDAHYATLAD